MKKIAMGVLQAAILAALCSMVIGQEAAGSVKPLSESDLALLRQDVQTQQMTIIANAMKLNSTEASPCWSLYRDYASAQQQSGDLQLHIITEYANGNQDLSDQKAGELARRLTDIDKRIFELRSKYLPMLEKILAPKRATKFFQVDRRLSLLIDLQLTSETPIID